MQIQIGIIGCGEIAAHHLDACQKNGAKIAAVTDLDPSRARRLAGQSPGTAVFEHFPDLLESGQVDAISICTPPSTHEEIAVAALERGIHVLCEKPLAHTVESGRRIAAAAAKSPAQFMPAFRHRFLPQITRMREMIDEGRIGTLVYLNNIFCGPAFSMKDRWFSRRAVSGGGTLMDTSSHSVDLFRFLAGEIAEQQALVHRHFPSTDVEDASVLIVRAKNGTLGSLTASWVAGDGVAVLEIMGQEGRLLFDYENNSEIRMKTNGEWQSIPVVSSMGFVEEVAHFLKRVQGEESSGCSVHDGLRALEVIQGAYQSEL